MSSILSIAMIGISAALLLSSLTDRCERARSPRNDVIATAVVRWQGVPVAKPVAVVAAAALGVAAVGGLSVALWSAGFWGHAKDLADVGMFSLLAAASGAAALRFLKSKELALTTRGVAWGRDDFPWDAICDATWTNGTLTMKTRNGILSIPLDPNYASAVLRAFRTAKETAQSPVERPPPAVPNV